MKIPILQSLRGRLTLLLLLAFVPAAALMVVTHFQQREFVSAEIGKTVRRITRLAAQKEETMMGSAQALVTAMAKAQYVIAQDRRQCEKHVTSLVKEQAVYVNLGYVDANGDLACSALAAPGKLNFADRLWFREARDRGRFTVGDYVISRFTGERVITYAYPIHAADGRFIGVSYAVTNLSWLKHMVAAVELPPGATAEVADVRGLVLARHPDVRSNTAATLAGTPILSVLQQRPGQGVIEASGADGRQMIYGFAPLSVASKDVYVLIGWPSAAAFAPLYAALWTNLLWLAILAALAVTAMWLAADVLVTRRVRKLIGFSEKLASGTFSVRDEAAGGVQELDQLASAFNRMAAELEQRERALAGSEARYRQLVELSPDAILIHADSRFIYANAAAVRLLKAASPAQIVGAEADSIVHPEYLALVRERIARQQRGEIVPRVEQRYVCYDGSTVEVEVTSAPFLHGTQRAIQVFARDVSERKRAETALRASEERFRSITESSTVGIFCADAAGRCVYVNRRWCEITALSPESAYGDGWVAALHPEDRTRVAASWERAVAKRGRFREEYRLAAAERKTWVIGEAVPENEPEAGFVGTITDITDRVEAEARMRASEERFRVFMNNSPAAYWIVDEHARFIYANKVMAELLESPEDSVVGKSYYDLYPAELAKQFEDSNRLVLRDRRVLETVEKAPRRDGSPGHFAVFKFPLRDSGGRGVVGGMAVDITERITMERALRNSEERFREFMDNNPAICWISDESGRITYVNRTYVQSLKLPFDPVGRHPMELFPTALARQYLDGIKAALAEGGAIETMEPAIRRDDSRGEFTVFRFPLVANDDRRSVGGIAIDITERRRAADELEQANRRLQSLSSRILEVQESERRQVARELHDEIGQSLTALKINLEGLHRITTDAVNLARVAENVELVAHTLEQVRRLSLDLRPSQLDDLGLEAAIRSTLNRQAAAGRFRGYCETDLSGHRLPGQIETACFRVCQEALTNVVRHSGAANVWVTVRAQHDRLELSVRDDGKGFDVAIGRQRAQAGGSFGVLGMEERAVLAGGGLEIESAPGAGTQVKAWFPIGPNSGGE